MALLVVRNVTVSFGDPPLLDEVALNLESGERVGLVGRNGEGKTTLLRIIAGELAPDRGSVELAPGARVAYLPQQVPRDVAGTVHAVVATGLDRDGAAADTQPAVEKVISRLSLDPDGVVSTLSAGLRRRVWLARALVCEPQVLLLDEPTNHLDIETIGWLEQLLDRFAGTLLCVTHDRVFLEGLVTRVVELDRGALYDWRCDYRQYEQRKHKAREDEVSERARFDKKLSQEEAWLRRGLKARRARNEGRVRALEQMREERRRRRELSGNAKLSVQQAEQSGKLVVQAEGVTFGYGDRPVLAGLSTLILRGDRVGIIGPNNCGKTTLLRVLLGELEPQQGTIRRGVKLRTAYFDQLREGLDEEQSVADNLAHGAEYISLFGNRRHVLGYLRDFLFTADRARSPVASLSGGERSRLLLAKLFAKPSNVLVLDEPTNDLDVETLELLEERLHEYRGTVLLVSHDRALLNNVVTSTLVFEGPARVRDYAGGYDDWLVQRRGDAALAGGAPQARAERRSTKPRTRGPRKLTFKEQRELEALPERIEQLEQEQRALQETLGDPAFYQRAGTEIADAKARLDAVEQQLEAALERWLALDEIAQLSRG